MEKNSKIYVDGHRGMVGSAIVRELRRQRPESCLLTSELEDGIRLAYEDFLNNPMRRSAEVPLLIQPSPATNILA